MGYEWGNPGRPAVGGFNGQLWPDDAKVVWEWDLPNQLWRRRDDYQLREVVSRDLICVNRSLGSDVFYRMMSTFGVQWDDAYALAFVEVCNPMGDAVYGRVAQVDKAGLSTWAADVFPNDGSIYTTNVRLRVFEVFSSEVRRSHLNGWNRLYGVLRGRSSYYGRGNRLRGTSQPVRAGVEDQADTFLNLDPLGLAAKLLEFFYTPASTKCPGDQAVWFARGRKSLYQHPKKTALSVAVGDQSAVPSNMKRLSWAWGESDWDDAPEGDWTSKDNATPTSTAVIWINTLTGHLQVGSVKDKLVGQLQVTEVREACIVHQLGINVAGDDFVAWMVKPLGITHLALDCSLPPASWDLFAVSCFRGPSQAKLKKITFQNRGSDGWRFNAWDALSLVGGSFASKPEDASIDTDAIPREVRFYFRHKVTGLRSELVPDALTILRRTNCAPLSLTVRRGAP